MNLNAPHVQLGSLVTPFIVACACEGNTGEVVRCCIAFLLQLLICCCCCR